MESAASSHVITGYGPFQNTGRRYLMTPVSSRRLVLKIIDSLTTHMVEIKFVELTY